MSPTEANVSWEHFFNEAEFRILIPNLDPDIPSSSFQNILDAPSRSFTFYDEQLKVYLFVSVPHHIAGTGENVMQAVHAFYNQLDVHLEASILDGTQNAGSAAAAGPPPLQPSSSFSSSLHHRSLSSKVAPSSSAPSSPKMHKREASRGGGGAGSMSAGTGAVPETLPFFSHTYNSRGKDAKPTIFEWDQAYCCLYPLVVPILYVKTRSQNPLLSIAFNVSYRPLTTSQQKTAQTDEDKDRYDADLFDTIDLLDGLQEDPLFASDSNQLHQRFVIEKHSRQSSGTFSQVSQTTSSPLLTLRRFVRDTVAIRPGINVKMRTTNASITDKMVMMSVELENPNEAGCRFIVDKVEVQVSNSVVTMAFSKEVKFPFTLEVLDQMVFLYDVTLLEDGSAKPPAPPARMFSSRHRPPPPVVPAHYQDDRLQPQRVSIQVYGSPIVDGVRALPMRSKWNTMLDVTGIRQKREDPDPRFSSLLASSPALLGRSSTSLSTSVSVSPGARSVGSPMSHLSHMDGRKRMVLANQSGSIRGGESPLPSAHPPAPVIPGGSTGGRRAETEVVDGIIISFTVPSQIFIGKIFPLHIFIVNRSKHTRRFQVMIPNRKRHPHIHQPTGAGVDALGHMKTALPPIPAEQFPIDPYMDEAEFLRQYFENETHEADIVCLENNVRLSPLGPSTSQAVDIRFIAVKEKLHTIDLIQLVDLDTGFVTNLRNVLEIFVESLNL